MSLSHAYLNGSMMASPRLCNHSTMLALLVRYGSWGVCFTYGTWFGIEALAALGESVHSSAVSALRVLSPSLRVAP